MGLSNLKIIQFENLKMGLLRFLNTLKKATSCIFKLTNFQIFKLACTFIDYAGK